MALPWAWPLVRSQAPLLEPALTRGVAKGAGGLSTPVRSPSPTWALCTGVYGESPFWGPISPLTCLSPLSSSFLESLATSLALAHVQTPSLSFWGPTVAPSFAKIWLHHCISGSTEWRVCIHFRTSWMMIIPRNLATTKCTSNRGVTETIWLDLRALKLGYDMYEAFE